MAPAHHAGQVGFFRLVERALETPAMAALDRELDDRWRADCDYIIADMNGSAVFLLAALQTRLGLAARRRRDGAGEAGRVIQYFEGMRIQPDAFVARASSVASVSAIRSRWRDPLTGEP